MPLPTFNSPTLVELREWYRLYRDDANIRRLVLEVQRARLQWPRLNELLSQTERAAGRADFGRLAANGAPLYEARSLVKTEMLRVGPVAEATSKGKFDKVIDAAAFDFDPDEAADRAAEMTPAQTKSDAKAPHVPRK